MRFIRDDGLFFSFLFVLLTVFVEIGAITQSSLKNFVKSYERAQTDSDINKVSFTQKGYIQFLRYIEEVPPLTEYTFCIWLRSNNLTYSHPLLSYSLHEEERLIRVWISPHGTDINLEIQRTNVFRVPVNLEENRWYHICQSWSSYQGAWNVYLDGKLRAGGFEPSLQGVQIKAGGDIVVGQEYTDFDKGLDDGIEGDISGFNFVLSSTSQTPKQFPQYIKYSDQSLPRAHREPYEFVKFTPGDSDWNDPDELPSVTRGTRRPITTSRIPKSLITVAHHVYDMFNIFPPLHKPHHRTTSSSKRTAFKRTSSYNSRISNDVDTQYSKPLGLVLVELSNNCALGKGAPLNGKSVLIHWTKSPVRVFGGAILKKVQPFCYAK